MKKLVAGKHRFRVKRKGYGYWVFEYFKVFGFHFKLERYGTVFGESYIYRSAAERRARKLCEQRATEISDRKRARRAAKRAMRIANRKVKLTERQRYPIARRLLRTLEDAFRNAKRVLIAR